MRIALKFGQLVLSTAALWLSTAVHAGAALVPSALGLPAIEVPVENPTTQEKVAVGKKLFFDARLSRDGSVSCASCHNPEKAFADGEVKSVGVKGRRGTRNAPSIITAAGHKSLFWDGRRRTLEDQALDPFFNSLEHGLSGEDELLSILRKDKEYPALFVRAFGADAGTIRSSDVRMALASFQRSIARGASRFDKFHFAGVRSALSPSEQRGLALFVGAAQCSSCHIITSREAPFADEKFHSLGIGMSLLPNNLDEISTRLVQDRRRGASADQLVIGDRTISELGRFVVTLNPADIGKFRTPSLRNEALTAPYMHDGSVRTLEDAIERELYSRGESGRPLILTPREKHDLLDFLRALNSEAPHEAGK